MPELKETLKHLKNLLTIRTRLVCTTLITLSNPNYQKKWLKEFPKVGKSGQKQTILNQTGLSLTMRNLKSDLMAYIIKATEQEEDGLDLTVSIYHTKALM